MRTLSMKIYNNSPIILQNMMTCFEGFRISKNRYGETYFKFLRKLENRNCSDAETTKEYQEKELRKLIKHAFSKSSFYKEFYKEIDLEKIQSLEDLQKLPILTEEMVRENLASIYTIKEPAAIVERTISQTGIPLKFLFTKEDVQKRLAFIDFFKKQHGAINLEMKRASFSPNPFIPSKQRKKIFWRENYYVKQRLYSTYFCNQENAYEFVRNLDEYKPDFIDGLPSAIFELAKYINENKIILSFRPVAIFTTAEPLPPYYRYEIEKAFDCPLRHYYAADEGLPFIMECSIGKMHTISNSGIIEVNNEGDAIVTCFNTYGTPLIRYNIGPQFKLLKRESRCLCGSVHPIVEELADRKNDFLESKSKGKFTAFYLAKVGNTLPNNIQKLQFIQNSLETIDVFVEGAPDYTNTITEEIHEKMQYTFGEDMIYNIRIVEKIPNFPNSKNRFVVNNLIKNAEI
ncbi:phenylacetate-CoA ligase [Planomicrobium soli]|uniref:Phenylacetate-CoA ligase n=1 Tax=Planomicrobium soli TaxID=1176648 RepID=A0A2P8GCI0_9BACL|nr:phenylacetate--CoA ligase family protein [Planomicrobium soli]PSL31681.1 phenylacetate-CoA ligase [Planomicrobium soli]